MPMKPEKLEPLVLKQGFVYLEGAGKGGHRRYQHPDGRTTEIPFHGHEVNKWTQEKILGQIGLR